jgi:hypothetical protein
MMTKKTTTQRSPDKLTKLGKTSGVELSEAQLGKVQGGFHFVHVATKSSPG